ncbi:MAG: sterol desaturase family protein [Alphaproteobacteria bacterium]
MTQFVLDHEPAVRLVFFLGVIFAMVAWEGARPLRARFVSRWKRWPSNLAIVALNAGMLRLAVPISAVGLALIAEQRNWGLFNNIEMEKGIAIVLSIIILDFAIYLQHVVFHAVPALWRLHRMHHADLDFDFTTGSRFHPGEIFLSMGIKCAIVAVLGPPAVSVILFEILLSASSTFNHGNVSLPPRLERFARWLVVTPDMHRVHHSDVPAETNSNFGFNLSVWDRLLGTYRSQPSAGHHRMTIGLDVFRDPNELRLDRMLRQPFVGKTGPYPMGGGLLLRKSQENADQTPGPGTD